MSISPSIAEKSKDDTQKAPSTVTHSENAQSTQNNSLNSYDELIDLQNILPDENRQKEKVLLNSKTPTNQLL